jgi:hypothetical protein
MKQTFLKIDVANFEQIQEKLIPWVKKRARWTLKFWNHVDQDQLFKDIPELPDAIEQVIGQRPLHTYMLVVPWVPNFVAKKILGSKTLHKDTSVESVRFNWPVLNGPSVETKLFASKVDPEQKQLHISKKTYLSYQEENCQEIGSFLLDKPALLHVHTIHGLYRASGPLPRYILTFKFEKPIDHLLNPI